MPSRHHHSHLREILKLEPDEEPWCAGYAPSQGRRCHVRTNAYGRSMAMSLLNEGTKDLHDGDCIDDLLKDLAPYVLCTRWHQNQASELVAKWRRRVDRFLDSYSRPPPPTPRASPRQGSLGVDQRNGRQSVATQCVQLSNGRHDPASTRQRGLSTSSLQIASSTSSTSTSSRTHLQSPRATPQPSRQGITSTSDTDRTSQSASVHITSLSTRNGSNHSPRPQTTIRRTGPPSSSIPVSKDVPRRPVQGDCSICLEPLSKPPFGPDNDSSKDSSDDPSDSDDDDDGDNEGEESTKLEPELSWCKAQCGVNYHKACIDGWLRSSTHGTCPTCRRSWKG
ncbi:hypothetical protein BDV12DRAFT_178295 [Aspergillus spectabilis]